MKKIVSLLLTISLMISAMDEPGKGKPRAFVVVGNAGSGKTKFADALAAIIEDTTKLKVLRIQESTSPVASPKLKRSPSPCFTPSYEKFDAKEEFICRLKKQISSTSEAVYVIDYTAQNEKLRSQFEDIVKNMTLPMLIKLQCSEHTALQRSGDKVSSQLSDSKLLQYDSLPLVCTIDTTNLSISAYDEKAESIVKKYFSTLKKK